MSKATTGNTVRIHYTGKLEDGTVFDSSAERDPIEFELGSGQVIPGIDDAVVGMSAGESKTFTVQPDKAYGPHHEQLVQSVPVSALPDNLEPAVGMQLESQAPDGQVTRLTVTKVTEDAITVDANHPLAGQALEFDIELVDADCKSG